MVENIYFLGKFIYLDGIIMPHCIYTICQFLVHQKYRLCIMFENSCLKKIVIAPLNFSSEFLWSFSWNLFSNFLQSLCVSVIARCSLIIYCYFLLNLLSEDMCILYMIGRGLEFLWKFIRFWFISTTFYIGRFYSMSEYKVYTPPDKDVNTYNKSPS